MDPLIFDLFRRPGVADRTSTERAISPSLIFGVTVTVSRSPGLPGAAPIPVTLMVFEDDSFIVNTVEVPASG